MKDTGTREFIGWLYMIVHDMIHHTVSKKAV